METDPLVRTLDRCRALPATHGGWGLEASRLGATPEEALHRISVRDPFLPSLARWVERHGGALDRAQVLTAWEAFSVGGPGSSRRYRWSLPFPPGDLGTRVAAWRSREAELVVARENGQSMGGRFRFASRLWMPAVLADTIEWLADIADDGDVDVGSRAAALLAEAKPRVSDDLAGLVAGQDAWADTLPLWLAAYRPRLLALHRGLHTAITARYAEIALRHDGRVVGRHYPFHEVPMPSASAHLAAAIAAIGMRPELLAPLGYLVDARHHDGGWGDPGMPTDLLTTLAAADVLGSLEPDFDATSVLPAIAATPQASNGWEILGPDGAWVVTEVATHLERAALPFAERFRWPHVAPWALDPHTGIPRFDAFVELARLFASLTGLAAVELEVAFVDLASFGVWNTVHGQAAGDDLLLRLAAELRTIPGARAIRDGGDEFLVVGAPGRTGLARDVERMLAGWPAAWQRHDPTRPAVPGRAVVVRTRGGDLRAAREKLGIALGGLKARVPSPGPMGVVQDELESAPTAARLTANTGAAGGRE